jgi:hypothetical protein
MVSKITNRKLESSCFIAQGFAPGKITVCLVLGGVRLTFKPSRFKAKPHISGCVKNEDKIHWTASVQNRQYLLDIDIFCLTSEMKLRNYDSPNGQEVFLSLLTGATGTGEIRLYKRRKKSLELIEHADIENAHCEYGGKDAPEPNRVDELTK